ncbi:MAG: hypothetical protein A2Y10_10505 [Planctomycetes bacterium GWF2_41_51]|nr:MAG: hypothetical protein A2Y10_10505 [Planctomycetes bacterium GWF2_41_51]HBG26906.1 hypothetical protein [Phycisphaerales bacterium]
MLKYKPDFEHALKYWDAFWSHELIDRPCTMIFAQKSNEQLFMSRLQAVDDDFSVSFSAGQKYLDNTAFLGEAMPGFRPGFGPDQMAAFLGMPLQINPDSRDTSWTEKIVEDWKDFMPLRLDENNHVWQRMKQFHKAAQEFCKDKCPLMNIDLHSSIDCLEAMRGAENLLFDIIDKPQLVDELMNQIRPIYKQIYNELWKYGDKQRVGSSTSLQLFSRGQTDMIQADFICLLSPDMFRRFVLPAIKDEAEFLTDAAFHLDGPDALKHLDDILAIKEIKVVQWVPGEGRKPNYQWPEVIHKIQAVGKSTVLYGTCEEIKSFHGQYKPELIVYEAWAKSPEEGQELLDWLKRNT